MTPHEQYKCIVSWTLWLTWASIGWNSFLPRNSRMVTWIGKYYQSLSRHRQVSSKRLKFHIFFFFFELNYALRSKESSETKWSSVCGRENKWRENDGTWEDEVNSDKALCRNKAWNPCSCSVLYFFFFFKGKTDVRQCSLLWTQSECFLFVVFLFFLAATLCKKYRYKNV